MYVTVLGNLSLLYNWWGFVITIVVIFVEHYFSSAFTYFVKRFNLLSEEILLTFFILSWVNLIITIIHLSYDIFW